MRRTVALLTVGAACLFAAPARADAPATMYIFPAGGQRGTEVQFRVGGLYLHDACPFEMLGPGVEAAPRIEAAKTTWFEGPLISLPDSQQAEDYPKDMAGRVKIAADAAPGARAWRVWTAQGAVTSRAFIVGDLPEVVEEEIDGQPIPVPVKLPVTINGRIFPREDVDVWSFEAKAGQTITCAVLAAGLGSPLEAQLDIRDARGRRIAESSGSSAALTDALARFTAPADGTCFVHVHDVKFGGLQHYVYRLTISAGPSIERVYPLGGRRGTTGTFEVAGQNVPSGPVQVSLPADAAQRFSTTLTLAGAASNLVVFDVDDLPEMFEREPNDQPQQIEPVAPPSVHNGRIDRPGDVDVWAFRAAKGAAYDLEIRAARLGSPLDSVLVVLDASGKELARSDDAGGQTDSQLRFTAPEDGFCFARVEERLASRGGPAFAYRLRILPATADFRLSLAADALSIDRGGQAKLKIRAERIGGFAGDIKLDFENLSAGVAASNPVMPGNANELEVTFKAEATAPIGAKNARIHGTANIADKAVSHAATFRLPGRIDLETDALLAAVCVTTPFKVKGTYEVKYAQRGATFVRRFQIERGGFAGPLEVRLADRQTRHLQGVTGPTITVPAGASEFEYAVFLPPWMEIGRTSRTVVMATGTVQDVDGSACKVSFTSLAQNEQIVALVDPGQLSLDLDRKSVASSQASDAALSVRVGRGTGVKGPVKIELIIPGHIRGVEAEPVTIAEGDSTARFALKFADGAGPFNMPLIVRATAQASANRTVVAEAKLEIVAPRD